MRGNFRRYEDLWSNKPIASSTKCLPDDGYVKWKDGSFGVVAFSILQAELSEACRRREGVFACVAGKTEAVGIHAGRFYHAF
jgi:hypothetical protein